MPIRLKKFNRHNVIVQSVYIARFRGNFVSNNVKVIISLLFKFMI